ncbi:hypothetical protein [Emcibacter sp. SYSU 3D8]|uniref:hypothetical protein n=1 Tax=Emcibacter sp. SYSU 3D8 TaxID=3133969 RepID=UPI0031FF2954
MNLNIRLRFPRLKFHLNIHGGLIHQIRIVIVIFAWAAPVLSQGTPPEAVTFPSAATRQHLPHHDEQTMNL